MRRLIILFSVMFISLSGSAFAVDYANQISLRGDAGAVDAAYGVADVGSGICAEIDSNGYVKVNVADDSSTNSASAGWSTSMVLSTAGAESLVKTGAAVIQSISFYSNAADAYALIYDAVSATGTVLYDVVGGANVPTVITFTTPIPAATGIYGSVSADADNLQITWKAAS